MTMRTESRDPLICGPTAVGKSALALELAARNNGEIVSLDSMQIYRGMDIGTATPSPDEMARVPHHLVNCHPLDYPSDAATQIARAHAAVEEIHARGRTAVIAGGTAMYVKMFLDGICAAPPADEAVREELREDAARAGSGALHARLHEVDPETARKVHPNDLRRIIRALEVYRIAGTPLSSFQTQWRAATQDAPYDLIGLTCPREELYSRINARVDRMMAEGLYEEVETCVRTGLESNQTASQAIGYKELIACLRGEMTRDEAVEAIKRNTRRFAKHQLTWFRKDPRITWCDVTVHTTPGALADAVARWRMGDTSVCASPPPRLEK